MIIFFKFKSSATFRIFIIRFSTVNNKSILIFFQEAYYHINKIKIFINI